MDRETEAWANDIYITDPKHHSCDHSGNSQASGKTLRWTRGLLLPSCLWKFTRLRAIGRFSQSGCVHPRSSEVRGPWTSRVVAAWELVRSSESQAPPQTDCINLA